MVIYEVIEKGKEELRKATGLEPASVIETLREDKGWRVAIEVVERKAVPDTADILGLYEISLDGEGNLFKFKRVKLRKRMDMEEKDK